MTGIPQLQFMGVMTPELLWGVDYVPRDHQRSYQEFFLRLIRERGFPLHTASLWNALYFGWSFDTKGYLGRGLRLDLARSGKPIPVGTFVEVKLGQNRIALAEVIYKEGRDPGISDLGLVPPAASGARLGLQRVTQPTPVCEGLVLDFSAFGEGVNDADSVVLQRAQRKKLLTEDQHLEVQAVYEPEEAGADDLKLFAHYLLAQYRDSLFEADLRDGGTGVSLDERRQVLLNSLQAVEKLADDTPSLMGFGSFHADEATYRADRSAGGDTRFGAEAIDGVVSAVVRVQSRRTAVTRFGNASSVHGDPIYKATAALVREHLGRDGLDLEERELLAGPSYARMVVESNLAIAEAIGDEGRGDGPNIYVRLDDEWQGGGVWRTLYREGDPPSDMRFPPLMALGRGYSDSCSPLVTPTPANVLAETPIERSDRGWQVALTLLDLHHRDLRLPPDAMAMLPADAKDVIVDFDDGIRHLPRKIRPLDRERRLIKQMLYPAEFLPGVIVNYTVTHGSPVIFVRAELLAVPEQIEGRTVRHRYNDRVLRHELRLTPIEAPGGPNQRSLTEMIADVFRRRGRPTPDEGLALRTEEILAALLGIDITPDVSGPIVLRLQAGDYEYRAGEYVWFPRVSRRTSPRERIRLKEASARSASRLRDIVEPEQESMYVRTYTSVSGYQGHKHDTYQAALDKYRLRTRRPDKLLPNQTWVPYELSRR